MFSFFKSEKPIEEPNEQEIQNTQLIRRVERAGFDLGDLAREYTIESKAFHVFYDTLDKDDYRIEYNERIQKLSFKVGKAIDDYEQARRAYEAFLETNGINVDDKKKRTFFTAYGILRNVMERVYN